METWQKALLIILGLLVIGFLIWYFFIRRSAKDRDGIFRLPLNLAGLRDIPAVPFSIKDTLEAAVKLLLRTKQTEQAMNGLQNIYHIGTHTANGRAFLYGQDQEQDKADDNAAAKEKVKAEMERAIRKDFQDAGKLKDRLSQPTPLETLSDLHPLTQLSLKTPEQYAMGWTVFADVFKNSDSLLNGFAQALKITPEGVEAATNSFWPNIANYGLPFNLLLPKKISATEYEIDLNIFQSIQAYPEDNSGTKSKRKKKKKQNRGQEFWRFTPACQIHLRQDPATKNLIPYSIEVSDYQGANSKTYIKDDGTNTSIAASDAGWMYALQAAKTAVTVWGIWLGHVYHWHIVTGALQMTMFHTLDEGHPVRVLLDPMSKFLIGFDGFLLLTFKHAAPPTSVPSGMEWMELENTYAKGRDYHDDDPHETLKRLGITQDDFTTDPNQPWDQYIMVRYLLQIWNASEQYVTQYVNQAWPTDADIVNDVPLHQWLTASGEPHNGNVSGLPNLNNPDKARRELIRLLTSYIYRISAHGSSRMNAAANPALSFVGNYPPTLQIPDLPETNVSMTTEDLLKYLPKTGTIGSMLTFLFTFVFSTPYESFIPPKGIDQELFFGDDKDTPMNQALIKFRGDVEAVIATYAANGPTVSQWPRNIET